MSAKERLMAIALIGVMCLVIGGLVFYQFAYGPYTKATASVATLNSEVDKLRSDIESAVVKKKQLERDRLLSLPVEANGGDGLARREYEIQLNAMMRDSKFPSTYSIKMNPTDTKSVPTFATKKPIYGRINSRITARGTFTNLITFLWKFYSQPLLHQVKSLTIEKAKSTTGGTTGRRAAGERRELEITMDVEALILDNAEKRLTLVAVPPEAGLLFGGAAAYRLAALGAEPGKTSPFASPKALAAEKREYNQIAWKDLFYGNVRVQEEKPVAAPGMDYSPYIKLTGLSGLDGNSRGEFFDLANKTEYVIEQLAGTLPTCEGFYFTGDRRKVLDKKSRYLSYGDPEKDNYHRFEVLWLDIEAHELYLRWADDEAEGNRAAAGILMGGLSVPSLPGLIYRLHPGQTIKDAGDSPAFKLSREAREFLYYWYGTYGAPAGQSAKGSKRPGL